MDSFFHYWFRIEKQFLIIQKFDDEVNLSIYIC